MSALEDWFGGRPRLIMFDLDGTLVDSVADVAAAIDRMRVQLDLPPPGVERVRQWVGRGAEALLDRVMADQAHDPILRQRAGELFAAAYAEAVHVHSRLFPGVEAALSELSGWCPLACITNKPLRFTTPLLQALDVHKYFTLVLGGDSLAEKKPHPLPLQHALQRFAVTPAAALMIGDSRNDVEAARAAGVRCIALRGGYNHGQAIEDCQPDWIIDGFAELL